MNNYVTIIIAFIIGQFIYTSITVYNLQNGKDIGYWHAYAAYLRKETGWFVIAIAGLCGVLFVLSDFVNLDIKKADLINKEVLSYKEKLVLYFRTSALMLGMFIQHVVFKVYKKGKEEVEKVNDKISGS
jgi:hypothetical protein